MSAPRILSAAKWLTVAAIVANELRGAILAAPVLYGLWVSGGTAAAVLLAACSLAGIALSVIVPLWLAKRIARKVKP